MDCGRRWCHIADWGKLILFIYSRPRRGRPLFRAELFQETEGGGPMVWPDHWRQYFPVESQISCVPFKRKLRTQPSATMNDDGGGGGDDDYDSWGRMGHRHEAPRGSWPAPRPATSPPLPIIGERIQPSAGTPSEGLEALVFCATLVSAFKRLEVAAGSLAFFLSSWSPSSSSGAPSTSSGRWRQRAPRGPGFK